MNRKITGRLLSLMLCAVLLLGMLPSVAAAAVSSVAITGVSVPAAGARPAASASVPEGSGYTVESVSWVGWENGQSEGSATAVADAFAGGWYYQVRITLAAGADTEFDSSLSATVNGSSQSVEVAVNSSASATVKRTFYVEPEAANTPISAVSVTGLTVPAAGQSPDFSATAGDSTYSVYEIVWYHVDSPAMLTQSDKFVAGVRYQAQVILEASSGYSFSSSVGATLNGNSAICGKVSGKDSSKYISILQEYTVSSENQITEVAVTDLTAPVKGAAPDMSVTVASSAPYLVDSIQWKKWKNGEDSTAAVALSPQEKFKNGYTYQANIILRAKTDYAFATDSSGEPAVSGTVNGAASLPGVSVPGKNAAQYVCICFDFSMEVKQIEAVSIANVIEPFAGQSASTRYRISPDALYTVFSVYWESWDGKQLPAKYSKMNSYTLFTPGMYYRIIFVLKANEGAEFITDERGQPAVTGTVNDAPCNPAEEYAGKDPAEYILLSFDFPVLTEIIQHVEVLKVDEPAEGKYPDYDVDVPKDSLYIVEEVTWEQCDPEKTPGKYVKMTAYEAFKSNMDYRVTFLLRAKEGGSFFVNAFEELQVTAAVNGNPTIPAEAVENREPAEYVRIGYDFSLSADTKLIKRVNIHDLEIPRLGETPDYQVNTDALAKYTVEEVIWEQLEGRRSSTVAEVLTSESIFQEGKYYRVQIVLKAGKDTAFSANDAGRPQVTAVLNNGSGMAAERYAGKDPEEYICISYVYGIFTVIEGGDSQWSPDKGELTFRFTGDYANFTGVRVDGVLLNEQFYTAASGSTIIILSEAFLTTLQDGIHELTVLYTDGQVSTKFQVSGGSFSDGGGKLRINLWFFLLPPVIAVLFILFAAAFIIRKRAEARIYKEEYEEYDEDEEE